MSIFPFAALGLMIAFLLGWLWPLIAGIVKTRRGDRSVGLIVFGGIWGSIALLSITLIGIGIYTALQLSGSYKTAEFNPEEYQGQTAEIVTPYKSTSTITARTSHDNARYVFNTTNGIFIVPASMMNLESYSISAKDEKGKVWSASWSLYSHTGSGNFNMETNSSLDLNLGPPIHITATHKEMADGKQNINIAVTDANGNNVNLRAQPAPSIQILDETENVVWTHKLSYG